MVSPTGIVTPERDIASSVTVITAAEIEREQRRTVPDALSTVPGLNVVQSGGPGGFTSVFMRGTNSNHVKVLIDGIDASDPSNPSRTFDFGQLLTADIARIEVLRGPQSGLYGSEAIGGVISIITKKGEGPARVTATTEAGSFATFNQYGSLSGSEGPFNYAFNVAHFRTASTPVTPLDLLPPGRQRNNDSYDNWTYSTKLGADVTPNLTFNWVGRFTDATLLFTGDDFSSFPVFPAAQQSKQAVHQFYQRSEAVWSLFDGRFVNYFGLNYTDLWNWQKAHDPGVPAVNKGDRTRYEWRGDLFLAPGHVLLLGLQDETDRLVTEETSAQTRTTSRYAELQTEILQRLFFVANVRYDHNDAFGPATTFRLAPAVIVPVTETKLKTTYGTGFKAPTLSQLYVDFPDFNFFGNPNLRPEESIGYDYGFEQPVFNNRFRFGVTRYFNDITNLILPNATFTSFTNVGKAQTSGYEAFAWAAVTDRLSIRTDYTYTKAMDATLDLELLRRPRHKYSVTATWIPIDQLVFTATWLRVSAWVDGNRDFSIPRLIAPGYTVVNLTANYIAKSVHHALCPHRQPVQRGISEPDRVPSAGLRNFRGDPAREPIEGHDGRDTSGFDEGTADGRPSLPRFCDRDAARHGTAAARRRSPRQAHAHRFPQHVCRRARPAARRSAERRVGHLAVA